MSNVFLTPLAATFVRESEPKDAPINAIIVEISGSSVKLDNGDTIAAGSETDFASLKVGMRVTVEGAHSLEGARIIPEG